MKITVNFRFSGFVGSERKNSFHKRVDSPLSSVTLVEMKKVMPPAGSTPPRRIDSSGKKAGRNPVFIRSITGKEEAGRNKTSFFWQVVCEKNRRRIGKFTASGTKGIESSSTPRNPAVS